MTFDDVTRLGEENVTGSWTWRIVDDDAYKALLADSADTAVGFLHEIAEFKGWNS